MYLWSEFSERGGPGLHKLSFLRGTRSALFAVVCGLLALQAGAGRLLSFSEQTIPSPGLHEIPSSIGHWRAGSEENLEPDIVNYLKPTEYILRDYASPDGGSPVNLFVAYFQSLDRTYGPHAPRICLPGSGWVESSSRVATLAIPSKLAGIPVNQLIYEKNGQRIVVEYWYQNNRRAWAEEFKAKLALLPDLIRYRRSDVTLIRLITSTREGREQVDLTNCSKFAKLLVPRLEERLGSIN